MAPSPNGNRLATGRLFVTARNSATKHPGSKSMPIGFHAPPKPAAPAPTESLAPCAPAQKERPEQAATPDKRIEVTPVPQRHRMRLAEALRKHGIDEQKLAAAYAYVMEKLKDRSDERGIEKLLIDVLKECSRLLEKENPPTKSEWRAASIPIVVHNVPRPERGPQSGGDNNSSE